MSKRTRLLLIALVWACCAGLCALPWLYPAVSPIAGRAQWALGAFTGAVFGWDARRRSQDGKPSLIDKLLLLVLAAFAGELIIPGLWGEIPAVALLGVSLWLVLRARRAA